MQTAPKAAKNRENFRIAAFQSMTTASPEDTRLAARRL
ncbi:hypothetical protein SAMN05444272_1467 [Roseibium suaedae]|uniref:Uncharacterized protein n=1 Tax=Roseibium suaedae TaxID=735517 RepID=A0A1M7F257_9HYPH|nr:hypothetical protein SAMN05444272_1467 [Roseibium suaedae]